MPIRHKLETTLNPSENSEVDQFCKKHKITRYSLVKKAVFDMIQKRNNSSIEDFA